MDMLLIVLILLGLLFDYTNGFHDAANVVSTVIATKVLRPLTAIVLAAVLNTLGATQISGVAKTISTGIVNIENASLEMTVCALVGAIVWNLVTWYFGMPSSSSYALIGGMIGAAFSASGNQAILWKGVTAKVLIPMMVAPFVGLILAYLGMGLIHIISGKSHNLKTVRLFGHLQIGSASIIALSHGLNDAQKSMGIITLGLFAAGQISAPSIPFWVIALCAIVMGLGTATGGLRIIKTLGFKITPLATPQGFTAELSSSVVILAASFLGMPLSSTQIITGSVAGVGAAKGLDNVRWGIAGRIAWTWLFTLPGTALVAGSLYKLISLIK